ncbi:uncharacterized protein LOC105687127 isoform X2 [Athalia rosae]|uniref:uncharacterized protein LOC105687127 isoform X2 n=1 Tax=Athalia rosae TaxID=37344 RepID=UPI0006254B83|nr:uncharacterized protein LOC105687127 isoform X2 [Athalia rosae]
MKVFAVLSALLVAVSADYCYNDVQGACSPRPIDTSDGALLANCNAKYGSFEAMQADLQAYVNAQIETSFEYLLMSSHFGNYEANRDGFKALYRKLSDKSWDDAFDLIKYIAKRGGRMNFNQQPKFKRAGKESRVVELNELNSLAKALDTQKQLADEALRLHSHALRHNQQDGAVAHYLEEKFMEPQAEAVRNLAGHVNDLKQLLSDQDSSVSVFIFDEFLQKSL